MVALVVLGIIVAILLPVFAQAREKAHRTVCAGNLRQIGLAALQYVQDNDGTIFPRRHGDASGGIVSWDFRLAGSKIDILGGSLGPYTKNVAVWYCPSAHNVVNANGRPNTFPPYGLNTEFSYAEIKLGHPTQVSAVGVPAETILLADSAKITFGVLSWTPSIYAPSRHQPFVHGRHAGSANVLWLDGHITARKPIAPFPDTDGNLSVAQLQGFGLGYILKGPYTGDAQTDNYYYELVKP